MGAESDVAIVGSGIVATAIAHTLVQKGHRVAMFEKGKDYPYPYMEQFQEEGLNLYYRGTHELAPDLRKLTTAGSYRRDLNRERHMVVGGQATRWSGISLRKQQSEFRTRTQFGYGSDWPISYKDLEPYYCQAEAFLGVSGTDEDNPFAPPRSKPLPLPPFPLTYADQLMAERMKAKGIHLHSTPQARARKPYDGRPACVNFGQCATCPIGARYSPQHHLKLAMDTGLVKLFTETSVRRVIVDKQGRAQALLVRQNGAPTDQEFPAKVIIIAAGAIESSRLLLLSGKDHPGPGLGNDAGAVGKNFSLHHVWNGELHFKERVFHGRSGPLTAQSFQFLEPAPRGQHGGLKLGIGIGQFARMHGPWEKGTHMTAEKKGSEHVDTKRFKTGAQVLDGMKLMPNCWTLRLAGEASESPQKNISLSKEKDRFGDEVAHVTYEPSAFDHATFEYAKDVFRRCVEATGASDSQALRRGGVRFGRPSHGRLPHGQEGRRQRGGRRVQGARQSEPLRRGRERVRDERFRQPHLDHGGAGIPHRRLPPQASAVRRAACRAGGACR